MVKRYRLSIGWLASLAYSRYGQKSNTSSLMKGINIFLILFFFSLIPIDSQNFLAQLEIQLIVDLSINEVNFIKNI